MKVYLTRRAEQNYNSIKDYIALEWGEKTAEEFAEKADKLFQLLEDFPEMGPIEKENIRGFQLSRQTRILYRIRENKIIVLSFFDVRQDPKKKFG